MMEGLNCDYKKGISMWLSVFQRDLDRKISEADNLINRVWYKCENGDAVLIDFIKALRGYKELMLEAIRLYNERGKSK